MSAYLPGLIAMVAVAAVILALMLWGWRRRTRRDADISVPTIPVTGEVHRRFSGLYVATTRHDAPLDRITAAPLAFRSRAVVTVTDRGVAFALTGQPTVFLAAETLAGAGRATWTIDRVVEPGGLVLIAWRTADGTVCDSYFRLQEGDPDALVSAVEDFCSDLTPTGAET